VLRLSKGRRCRRDDEDARSETNKIGRRRHGGETDREKEEKLEGNGRWKIHRKTFLRKVRRLGFVVSVTIAYVFTKCTLYVLNRLQCK